MSAIAPANEAGKPRDATRVKILEAARELFGTLGFDGTTVREIAERVGLTDAALYYHFKSKREILTSLWDVPTGGGIARLKADGPLTGVRLDAITDAAIEFSVANDHMLRLMCREALSGDQTAAALRLQNRAILRRVIQEHFATVVEPPEAELRTEAVMAVTTGTSMRTQMETGPGFKDVAASPEFRERTRRWVRMVARLDEVEAG